MSFLEILLLLFCGIGMGFNLMGMSTAIFCSPLLIAFYGSHSGNAIMFIPFFISNLFISYQYRQKFNKKLVLKILPFAILGLIIASIIANHITEDIFRKIIAIIIIFASVLFFLKRYTEKLTHLGWAFGIFAAMSSYLSNIAGPILNVYFLSFNEGEDSFIATRSIFFSIFNIFKLGLYIFVFKNINMFTVTRAAISIPTIFLGVFLAKIILKHISQNTFSKIIVSLSILVALKLLF